MNQQPKPEKCKCGQRPSMGRDTRTKRFEIWCQGCGVKSEASTHALAVEDWNRASKKST